MQPKLKENPREWQKFTAVMAVAASLISFLLFRRAHISRQALEIVAGASVVAVLLSLFVPRLFRGFYRGGMTISFHAGQVMGRILLTVFFVFIVTPLGLVLRVLGKDLLKLKWDRGARTYFTPAKFTEKFDRMF